MPISIPSQITVPFATSGLKNAIPATANNVTGNAGYDAGFPTINMTPTTAGGIPPFGQDFNGIIFDMTTALRFIEAGGTFVFSSAFATAVGGYPIGAIVQRTDNAGFWRNTVANNSTDPEAGGAGWQPEDAGITSITMTNANVTLTSLQASRRIIAITGLLTSNLNLILPTYQKQWLIVNNCTGAFTITVKTAAGSGFPSAIGTASSVYGDGTNINGAQAPGRLINVQTFTANGTYTPTPGMTSCIIEAQGGGGAGAGITTPGAGNISVGAPGGCGSYAMGRFTAAAIGASQSVTVGAAGASNSGAAGGNGGTTSVGALVSCPGGSGGGVLNNQVPPTSNGNGVATSAPTGGNIISTRGITNGVSVGNSATFGYGGAGGPSKFGNGASGGILNGNGTASLNNGAGGGGTCGASGSATLSGGAGFIGIVIIWEYA